MTSSARRYFSDPVGGGCLRVRCQSDVVSVDGVSGPPDAFVQKALTISTDNGYDGANCSQCADGYEGYPDCAPVE